MPAQLRDAAGDLHQFVPGSEIHQPLHEVEAHAAYACGVELLQLLVRDGSAHRGDATGLAPGRYAGIHHGPVVRTVARGLHDHVAGKSQVIAQREQLRL
jgi:hypothetical protein